jgi:nondiscriminating glutamyl-tRNA synthetase
MQQQDVRVRFAPSPTGYLHVGGLRTALYNYLFAKRNNGIFVLRIEDTDRSRYVEGATENLINTLRWMGLNYDEGPGTEGKSGPYIQSERTELYQTYANLLIEKGWAYRSFTSQEELERLREQAGDRNLRHDNVDRQLSEEEVSERLSQGVPHTVRLKVPLVGELSFRDIVRGEISMPYDVIDDQVLLKSDGYPTYHLANVVDDHLMGITHVIRGEEWLPSTPKHILLYKALEWELPAFAHLPLLLNPDKSKLSKRQGDVAVEDFRAKGYLKEALLNFVSLLGWSAPDNREMLSMDDLIKEFDFDRVGKSGAVFDVQKLDWFNGQYLRSLPPAELEDLCRPHLLQAGLTSNDSEKTSMMIDLLSKYLTFPSEIVEHAVIFYEESKTIEDSEAQDLLREESAAVVLRSLMNTSIALTQWTKENIKAAIKDVQQETGIKGKNLFMPIRIGLTGRKHGPDIPAIAEIFGKDKCISRLRETLDIIG